MVATVSHLPFTGERMVPEAAPGDTFWEHVFRYRFATQFVKGRRVLDIACGEGYGSAALLQAGAASLVGIDISEEACRHARGRYGIDARVGDAHRIDLPSASIDTVVSYETIEHIARPEAFLDEVVRILSPGGTLVVSTPNKNVYTTDSYHNEFHCSEMTPEEFSTALGSRFREVAIYVQHPMWSSRWNPQFVAAERSPWFRFKGGWRVRRLLLAMLCPYLTDGRMKPYRDDPVRAILSRPHPCDGIANPYTIRERKADGSDNPLYLVAVARL